MYRELFTFYSICVGQNMLLIRENGYFLPIYVIFS